MASAEPTRSRRSEGVGPPTNDRDPRWWLVTALTATLAMAVLFLRSQGPFDTVDSSWGVLGTIAILPLLALLLLVFPGAKRMRRIGAAVAYAGAAFAAFAFYAISVFPGGAPDTSDPSRPVPLSEMQSLIGVTLAITLVMSCASLYVRGRERTFARVFAALFLGACIVLKTVVFR